jgi:sigma-54 dependent transcriptional regulator, acetoin dehydrogenase operon transcriptional activator AcoR
MEHLPDDFLEDVRPVAVAPARESVTGKPSLAEPSDPPTTSAAHAPRSLDEIETDVIRRTLEACGGNISQASKRLGISRNTIYRKLRWGSASAQDSTRDSNTPAQRSGGSA